ncbi:hypothetical protein KC19_VG000600 [Ceratodon purpureus]|uniref:Uncharacterized protein n=1 Tax=Ceratodon purpureus TaxID=3225 RepID=A0A8T0HKG7_CERPU|nr:hypothetical protein KC19_VG000600 [Ceratodon purpureus]
MVWPWAGHGKVQVLPRQSPSLSWEDGGAHATEVCVKTGKTERDAEFEIWRSFETSWVLEGRRPLRDWRRRGRLPLWRALTATPAALWAAAATTPAAGALASASTTITGGLSTHDHHPRRWELLQIFLGFCFAISSAGEFPAKSNHPCLLGLDFLVWISRC